ncbi:Kynurenine 3-monooxygenase [Gemmata sp. SH-PL17]|uniref:FAD-dependent oxidoreductase n=1 Tax=Gemmata sp. SH-PL17 TaxID=1630693 RepID=UPI00078CB5E2|nr:NAD(P)/FAD-dependent oxidoreductase [Gemmata sp. SH-PL17]AMV23915.1 Kynurenine 3-monooxygenase [Gemmata sp. SH-PL17]
MREVTLVGGGLSGALLALMLARRGVKVTVYERRADVRAEQIEEGRSINLALSVRGIHALNRVGLDTEVLARAIPMRGRYIHPVTGSCSLIPYGRTADEVIHSVGRRGLNVQLLDALAREKNATVHFQHRCTNYNLRTQTPTVRDESSGREFGVEAPVVIGTDGAASAVRLALMQSTRMNYAQEYLDHGYKELTIPPAPDGTFRMEPNALHIWPRGGYMMIALPNLDRSFTCTLFLPHRGEPGFDQFSTPDAVTSFFTRTFPDAVPLIADLPGEFFRNPTGGLVTVRCSQWYSEGRVLLLGDAAHAIVPFFGQGMNCAFEDCEVLADLFDEHGENWDEVFPRFFASRKPNTDAIAQLALDNFIEMRDTSADPHFALKRQLEHKLEERYPGQFVSKYGMVSFHRTPYRDALERGRVQDRILMDVCARANALAEIDIAAAFARLRAGA